jgi:hypothetical protein
MSAAEFYKFFDFLLDQSRLGRQIIYETRERAYSQRILSGWRLFMGSEPAQ